MRGWTEDQLRRIFGAAELEIAPVRRNGALRSHVATGPRDLDVLP